jgi:hypothetical protein
MAKNSVPMASTGGGVLSKLVSVVVALAFLAFAVKHPTDAAHWLIGALSLLGNVIDGLASFLSQLHG